MAAFSSSEGAHTRRDRDFLRALTVSQQRTRRPAHTKSVIAASLCTECRPRRSAASIEGRSVSRRGPWHTPPRAAADTGRHRRTTRTHGRHRLRPCTASCTPLPSAPPIGQPFPVRPSDWFSLLPIIGAPFIRARGGGTSLDATRRAARWMGVSVT